LALLAIKVAPASKIAEASGQQRSNTYLILKSLEEKGLVSEIERGKVRHFVAEPPQRLITYLRDRGREMRDLEVLTEGAMPLLTSLTRPLTGKPRISMVSGLAGMRQAYRDTLLHDFVGVFNAKRFYEIFNTDFVNRFFEKGIELHGRDLAVDNDAGRRFMREWEAVGSHEVRLLPPDISFESDIMIFGDTIAMFAYDDEKTVIRIDNRQLADMLRKCFDVLWLASRDKKQIEAEESPSA
jgi:hypothetical protein